MGNIKDLIRFCKHQYVDIALLRIKKHIDILRTKDESVQEYPSEIQLPITYKCNYDCVMCGMRNLIHNADFSCKDLALILSDKLFSNVTAVGVNGGEPFLKKDIVECIDIIVGKLPRLKKISMISNGYFTEKMETLLPKMKEICDQRGVELNLSLSLDGIDDMQNFHRGNKNAWSHFSLTYEMLNKNLNHYVSGLNIICTITKYNIYRINEVKFWAEKKGVEVAYNIATVNVRIDNYSKVEDFTIFNDEVARMMAQEFFYRLFAETKSKRYYAIYYFIKNQFRIAPCACMKNKWVTLTPNGQIGYCATHSKELGNALEESAYKIFNGNLNYLEELKQQYCDTCSHYMYVLTKEGKRAYYDELIRMKKVL